MRRWPRWICRCAPQLINLMLELQEKQGISGDYVTQHGYDEASADRVLVIITGSG